MQTSDADIFVGHNCEVCGKRVSPSKGGGYWRVDPLRQGKRSVRAWHIQCFLDDLGVTVGNAPRP